MSKRVTRSVIELAASTDRMVARSELVAAGLTRAQIAGQIESGLMTRVFHGVYVVGTPRLTQRELLRAGLLKGGPASQLAEATAAEVRSVLPERLGHVSIAVPRPGTARTLRTQVPMTDGCIGVAVFRSTTASDTEEVDGLRCTTMTRTLVDLAATRGEATLRRAWKEADYLRLLDPDSIAADLDRMSRKGVAAVAALFAEMPDPIAVSVSVRTRTELRLLRLIEGAGLPRPRVDVPRRLGDMTYRFDFFYEQLGLVIELDDASHQRPSARVYDAERDRRCRLAGLAVVRITTAQLRRDPSGCLDVIRNAIEARARFVTRACSAE